MFYACIVYCECLSHWLRVVAFGFFLCHSFFHASTTANDLADVDIVRACVEKSNFTSMRDVIDCHAFISCGFDLCQSLIIKMKFACVCVTTVHGVTNTQSFERLQSCIQWQKQIKTSIFYTAKYRVSVLGCKVLWALPASLGYAMMLYCTTTTISNKRIATLL